MSISAADFQECVIEKLVDLGLIDEETAEGEDVSAVLEAALSAIDGLVGTAVELHDFMLDAAEAGRLNHEEIGALPCYQEADRLMQAGLYVYTGK